MASYGYRDMPFRVDGSRDTPFRAITFLHGILSLRVCISTHRPVNQLPHPCPLATSAISPAAVHCHVQRAPLCTPLCTPTLHIGDPS